MGAVAPLKDQLFSFVWCLKYFLPISVYITSTINEYITSSSYEPIKSEPSPLFRYKDFRGWQTLNFTSSIMVEWSCGNSFCPLVQWFDRYLLWSTWSVSSFPDLMHISSSIAYGHVVEYRLAYFFFLLRPLPAKTGVWEICLQVQPHLF